MDRYIFNRQIDRNIINCDTALDVCICKLWSVGRAIAAGYGFSIQLILVSAINEQRLIIQVMLLACQSHQLHLSYENADFRKLCLLSHRIFLRQNRCEDIGTAVVVLVRLIIAIPSLIGGFDRLSVLVKFFKIVLWGDPAVKFRIVALIDIQLPGHAGNPADILICIRLQAFFFGVSFRIYLLFAFCFWSIL